MDEDAGSNPGLLQPNNLECSVVRSIRESYSNKPTSAIMSNRHRRTRIYGANYDIGESYYKKQLNDLDNKRSYSRGHESSIDGDTLRETKLTPRVTFFSDDSNLNDNTSNILRKLNLNVDDEDHITQGRPSYKEDDFDTSDILRKINSHSFKDESLVKQRKSTNIVHKDYDFDEEFPKWSLKSTKEVSVENDRNERGLGFNFNRISNKDSILKEKSPFDLGEKVSTHISLRSKIRGDSSISKGYKLDSEDASSRVNATKARLLDLDEEIMSITNKQNEREKRNKNLKKMLSAVSNNDALE
ncbi:hypothetical protein DOY81_002287 [Sarcophaga bullata]|nr:hypothetical protein DOY81_002287 [Sarcophaga bullata]